MKNEEQILKLLEYVLSFKTDEDNFIDFNLSAKELKLIERFTGLKLEDYKHVITASGIRHVWKKHGPGSKDPCPLEINDFILIPLIVSEPDKISLSDKKTRVNNNEILVYEKIIIDKHYYLLEIRNGRKKLAIHTMYKTKIKRDNK